MKLFKSEIEAGLASLIEKNNSIAYTIPIKGGINAIGNGIEKLRQFYGAEANDVDSEIFYFTKSILATSSWNKNDDVFGPQELWAARKTPIHTFTDIDHDHDQIVGHIIDTWAIDDSGAILSDDFTPANLPDKFHLCNSAVIYKFPRSRSEVAAERAAKLISEIESGTKFVSMECIFPHFDYAVVSPENKHYVIARNEETAFLTKHLRIYGGQGIYNNFKIGRFLKDMVFSGKGYVDKPANPESIIFDKIDSFSFSKADYQINLDVLNISDKIIVPELSVAETEVQENNKMADEMQKLLDEAKAEIISLQKQLSEANVKTLQDTISELESKNSQAVAENKSLSDKIKELETSLSEVTVKNTELTKSNDEFTKLIAEAEAQKIFATRVSTLVSGGIEQEVAESHVKKFESLSDEQFSEIAKALTEAAKMMKEDKKEDKEEPAKAEDLEIEKVEETEAGDAAGSFTEEEESEVETVRLSIANYLGASLGITPTKDGE